MAGSMAMTGNMTPEHSAHGRPVQFTPQAAFDEARRHSRRVRILKTALPVLAVAIALAFIGYSWIITPAKISLDLAASGIVDGKLVMASPKLDGFTKSKLPYTMTATRAIQEFGNMDRFELEGITALLPVSDKVKADIKAATGVFDNKAQKLDITSPIRIVTSDGMNADLTDAKIDIKTGRLETAKPVDIRLENSRIQANSFIAEDQGKVLIFENNVRMVLRPDELKNRQKAQDEAAKAGKQATAADKTSQDVKK
ncbi:MAG: LPS export ABC transporter periplasmic protein LptC [Notoacmeibacter sp.]|nr:LPS export ABC transporter periplasmic protein LptC [Notoacmeibacter sp.]MCC0032393.1 LPS export ABC transporter periplasmic protein LptC [Brucellaceae bacterium]